MLAWVLPVQNTLLGLFQIKGIATKVLTGLKAQLNKHTGTRQTHGGDKM